MKNKKLLLGILIGLSLFGIAAQYGAMDVLGILKVNVIEHYSGSDGVSIESVQMLNNTVRANAFYVGETELVGTRQRKSQLTTQT